MKKLLVLLAALWVTSAHAANVNIDGLPAASSVQGANLFECEQSGVNRKCTGTQISTYNYGLMSGDATASGAGAVTLATVNANVGAFGDATHCVTFTTNAKGLITAASATTCTPAIASVTGLGTGVATALGVNVGTAGAFVVNGGALGTPSSGTLTSATGLPISTGLTGTGTGVLTAMAANLSAAGGLTTTIASGTAALGTSAISSATCATVVTVSATNVATTDVVTASFNGDPTGVTGYVPLTSGMLTIIGYPTANNVNFKVCNNTAGSITPGAITLNWRVVR